MEKKSISKAQQKAVAKYVNNHYDRIGLVLPKGYREVIKKASSEEEISVNEYIRRSIDERLDKSGNRIEDDSPEAVPDSE